MKEYPKALYLNKSTHVIVNDEIEDLEYQEQGYGGFADAPDEVVVDVEPDTELAQLKQELVEFNADNEALHQRNELLTKENEQLKAQIEELTKPIDSAVSDTLPREEIIAQLNELQIEFNPKAGTAVLAAKLAKAQE